MTPVMYTDIRGYSPNWGTICWVAAAVIVVALVVTAVVITGPAGLAAIGYAAQGIALTGMSTSATVFTFAAAGSAGALASAGIYASLSSKDKEEFNDFGPTALAMTATGGFLGGYSGYLATRPSFYRAMSAAEVQAVQDSGYLRGGRNGQTFFTNSAYYSSASAQSQLSLPTSPDYMMQFRILNNPNVFGPQTVAPMYGYSGGGIEYYTFDAVRVVIESVWKLN